METNNDDALDLFNEDALNGGDEIPSPISSS